MLSIRKLPRVVLVWSGYLLEKILFAWKDQPARAPLLAQPCEVDQHMRNALSGKYFPGNRFFGLSFLRTFWEILANLVNRWSWLFLKILNLLRSCFNFSKLRTARTWGKEVEYMYRVGLLFRINWSIKILSGQECWGVRKGMFCRAPSTKRQVPLLQLDAKHKVTMVQPHVGTRPIFLPSHLLTYPALHWGLARWKR